MKRILANAVFYSLLVIYLLLMWAMMWAAENMDYDPEERVRQQYEV
jgi:hypothetical protein